MHQVSWTSVLYVSRTGLISSLPTEGPFLPPNCQLKLCMSQALPNLPTRTDCKDGVALTVKVLISWLEKMNRSTDLQKRSRRRPGYVLCTPTSKIGQSSSLPTEGPVCFSSLPNHDLPCMSQALPNRPTRTCNPGQSAGNNDYPIDNHRSGPG